MGVQSGEKATLMVDRWGWVLRGGHVAWIGGLLSLAVGCAGSSSQDFDSEWVIQSGCGVLPEQRGSFMAKVVAFPLRLSADLSFTPSEREAILAAVMQWNGLAAKLGYARFFDLQFSGMGPQTRSGDPRDCEATGFGTEDSLSIVRETSAERWKGLGFNNFIPGATLRCFRGAKVDHQIMMIYATVVDQPQLSSVILHELGHVVGLDHSCANVRGHAKYVGCAGLASSHPYHEAVMFPTLRARRSSAELPEIKDRLRDNDDLRTRCIYGR